MPARTRGRAKFDFRGRPFVRWVDGDRWLRISSLDKRFVVSVPLGIEGDETWPVVGVIGSEFPGVDPAEQRPVWLVGPTLPTGSLGAWVDAVLTWAFRPERPLTRTDAPRLATPIPIRFDVWLAALDSGYAPLRAFVAWASARWLADPRSPQWVFRLAMARDVDQAKHALCKGWPEADEWATMRELLAPDEWAAAESVVAPSALAEAELHLGFLYLRYEAGELSLAEMFRGVGLRNVADEIDRYGNRGGGPTPPGPHPLTARVPTLFAPRAATARAAIPHLAPGARGEPGPTP